ncbi:uncharacterized protein LOC135711328 [Ochlerotatus camptorhynchus]|uniref:uncharacterized protein LOC135711328 n=1 Tax=Ochlerotatus camptorhynchus TaxID=644619 RepID=UPI0031CF5C32
MTSRRPFSEVAIATAVLVLFATTLIDRGVALKCHFCVGINHCNATGEEIEPINCTDDIVRRTNESLASFMPTLVYGPKISEDAFQCVHVRATSLTDMTFLFVRGCVYSMNSTGFCDIRYASFRGTRECVACDHEDLCNDVAISDAGKLPQPAAIVTWLVTLSTTLITANNYLHR